MGRDEVETKKFVDPNDEWKCFICLRDELELAVFAEDDDRVYLICEPCRSRTARSLLENETLRNL